MSIRREVQIGDCRLILGDCLEVLPLLGRVDVTLSDPPYGVGLGLETDPRTNGHGLGKTAYANFADTFDEFKAIVVPAISEAVKMADRAAVFGGHNIVHFPAPNAIGGIYFPSGSGRNPWGFSCFSPIWFYGKAPELNHGARPTSLYSCETAEKNGHPCPKPIGWMKWLVDLASRLGETVLDPFMGSGTTGVACVKLGRRFIGIEIDEGYFDIACERIRKAYAQPDFFVERPSEPKQEAFNI